MGNAIELILGLPKFYFLTILNPFSLAGYSAVPATGVVFFVFGAALGLKHKDKRLWLFLIPVVASEILVGLAGFFSGDLLSPNWLLLGFLAFQVLCAGFLIYRLNGARFAACFLSFFSVTFAFTAVFSAAMEFTNVRSYI